jgi:uncharacterized protein YacL
MRAGWRLAGPLVGAVGGFLLGYGIVVSTGPRSHGGLLITLTTLEGLIFAYLAIPYLVRAWRHLRVMVRATPLSDLLTGGAGLVAGLVVAALAAVFIRELPYGIWLSAVLALLLGYAGASIGLSRRGELGGLVSGLRSGANRFEAAVVDTSVVIDGRVLEIARTGFFDVPLKVPRSVLKELQQVADSADPIRRGRGRRGLDVLAELQQEPRIDLAVYDDDDLVARETDARLIELSRRTGWALMTNDFNLNRVAKVEGIRVLNLNELATAMRQAAVPGDHLEITVVREGREPGQGVAYLDDGTMVVVENGRRYLNQRVTAVVTSVLQTAAGRMVFAQVHAEESDRRRAVGH